MSKTPKLRFPEFSGEWEESNLKRMCEINPKSDKLPDTFLYIDLESILKGVLVKKNIIKFENAPSRAQRLLCNGDILFQTVRPYQMNNFLFKGDYDMPSVASTGYAQLRVKSEISNNEFIYQIIYNKKFNNQVMTNCTGTSYPAITSSELSTIPLMIPSLQEQQKIASFLSLVDKKIEKQSEKVEAIKEYKKGMMQKIFSREIRFKDEDGKEYPEWEEKKLGDISKITTGNRNVDDNIINGEYRFFDRGIDSIKYLNEYFLDSEAIIYPGEGSEFMPRYYLGKFALHQRCYAIYDVVNSISVKYLFYYMTTLNKYFLSQAVGTTVSSLRQDNFLKCKVLLPCLQEQQKIANFLSTIDTKLEKEEEKLETLKEWKKGLLQQMFV